MEHSTRFLSRLFKMERVQLAALFAVESLVSHSSFQSLTFIYQRRLSTLRWGRFKKCAPSTWSSICSHMALMHLSIFRCCKCNDLTGGGMALLIVDILVFWPIALIPCFMADCKNKNQIPIYGYPGGAPSGMPYPPAPAPGAYPPAPGAYPPAPPKY